MNIKILEIRGVPTYVNWSVSLLLGYLFFMGLWGGEEGGNLLFAIRNLCLGIGLYIVVIIHEYFHVFAGQRFGIPTEEIGLYVLGGIAKMKIIPSDKNRHEMWVALAGPFSNLLLAIFGLILVYILAYFGLTDHLVNDVIKYFIGINVIIGGFNMLPAFPMDGGRVVRSFFATIIGIEAATYVSAILGMLFSVIFIIVHWLYLGGILLPIIALFVFFNCVAAIMNIRSSENLI